MGAAKVVGGRDGEVTPLLLILTTFVGAVTEHCLIGGTR